MSAEISSAMSHYLGNLFRLGANQAHVSPSEVASEMEISPPAAARMFGKLEKHGLVERQAYHGVRLTRAGERAALNEIRAHRLSEAFLVRVMGYGWHEAHDLADQLAELGNEQFVNRMEEKAGFPDRCPHGEPIPSRDGIMPQISDQPLTDLAEGSRGRISRVRVRQSDKLQYLAEQGLLPSAEFEVAARAPFGGPIKLSIGRHESVLGAEIAGQIYVEVLTAAA